MPRQARTANGQGSGAAITVLGILVGALLAFPSAVEDTLEVVCDRLGLCTPDPAPAPPVPPKPDLVARPPEPPPCRNAPTVAVRVIDLRDGSELPQLAGAIARLLATARLPVTAWPFDAYADPMVQRDAQTLQMPGMPAVLVLGQLEAQDRNVSRIDGRREFYEIDGTLTLRVLAGPCGRRTLREHRVNGTGIGERYELALGSLAEEMARAFNRVLAVDGP
jgi:hypothetical protein